MAAVAVTPGIRPSDGCQARSTSWWFYPPVPFIPKCQFANLLAETLADPELEVRYAIPGRDG